MKSVSIIGNGGWGTALAMLLYENGHNVTVWGSSPENIKSIKEHNENKSFLPGVHLPEKIRWTSNHASAVEESDIIVLATPTKYFRSVLESFIGLIPLSSKIVSVAKGLDSSTHNRMTKTAEEILKVDCVSALSGPSHAEEVARRIPTAVVIASRNQQYCTYLQDVFTNDFFRVYTSDDVIGVELGGTLKNIIAIAVGISDGMGFGDNTRAALITRGLVEITRLGVSMGADPSTFAGLSGMGDLIVTCTSQHSRNRAIGEKLGRGETIEQVLGNMKQASEGVWNCASAKYLAEKSGIDVPITEEVFSIIHEGRSPEDAVRSLMRRNVKQE